MPECPQISLIIPVYNVEAYLEECLQSVAGQTFNAPEVILVNDGSNDGSAAVCRRFLAQHPAWIYIEQPNQGVCAARKAGLVRASGEYISFLDADDVISPDYLADLWTALKQTGAELAVAPMYRFAGDIKTARAPEGSFWAESCLEGAARARLFENFSASLALCGKLISRRLWQKVNPELPVLRTGDDILPSVGLIAGAEKIAPAAGAAYYYRQARADSQSGGGTGRFYGLLEGFSRARACLIKAGQYPFFAAGFERVRMICLTSFIEKFPLGAEDEQSLRLRRGEFKIPHFAFEGWPWKLRLRARLLYFCLCTGLSYKNWMRRLRLRKR